MKNNLLFFLLLASFIAFQTCQSNATEETESTGTDTVQEATPELQHLFHKTAEDWEQFGNASWEFTGNTIIGRIDTGSGFLMTKTAYADFELTLEFNPDSTINSGVFTRCEKKELSPITCFEFNIWDLHPNQEFRTGALVTKTPPLSKVETLNKWNSYKIKCVGGKIESWINDVKMVDLEDESLKEGYIAIQAAGTGVVKFRNLVLSKK